MQTDLLLRLSLFGIFRYVSKKGAICDFLSSPRPCFFLATLLSGSAVFESSLGEKIEINEGDIVFIPQGAKYRSFWGNNTDNVYISLRFDFAEGSGIPNPETLMLQKVVDDEGFCFSKKLASAYTLSEGELHEGARALSIFYDLLSYLLPRLRRSALPANDRRLSPAINYIRSHLSEDVPVPYLARLCSMSEPNLYLLFRKSLGESPVEYKNRLRIERAQQLLISHPDMPIEQVADAAGFESAAYFRRRFKEYTKESPRDFRTRASDNL